MAESEYVTVGWLREQLGVSKATMARLIADGVIPTVKNEYDRRIKLVRRADADAVIEDAWQKRAGKALAVAA